MNPSHLVRLCKDFELGSLLNTPTSVHGGLLHLMWRVNTTSGSYAIKQLSPKIDLTNTAIIKNYNLTERIATRFAKHGIPAVHAINASNTYLEIIDGIGFLIYPWVNATPLHQNTVSESHALKMAGIFAKIHSINLDAPEIEAPVFDVHSNESLIALFQKTRQYNCPFANMLTDYQHDIISINNAYQQSIPILSNHIVVSHGDLDQKNVLWDHNDNPILIDWECARKLNPTYEIVNAALDWSGISHVFNQMLFTKMLESYTKAGGHIEKSLLQAAFNGILGNWINWMVYNIERACDAEAPEQRALGIEQVNQVLQIIMRLKLLIPNLIKG